MFAASNPDGRQRTFALQLSDSSGGSINVHYMSNGGGGVQVVSTCTLPNGVPLRDGKWHFVTVALDFPRLQLYIGPCPSHSPLLPIRITATPTPGSAVAASSVSGVNLQLQHRPVLLEGPLVFGARVSPTGTAFHLGGGVLSHVFVTTASPALTASDTQPTT